MSTFDGALLSILRKTPLHLPGSELAALLRSDAATVAKSVAGLCEAGFEIEDRPGLGYRMLSAPDRLIADDLLSRLGPSSFIRNILVFAETDSTNQRAVDLGESGAAGGVAIFAERQTRGRGRFGRRWESAAAKGLWFSLLLRPSLPMTQWPRLTTWAAVAVAETFEALGAERVKVKWPNDVEIDGRKAAGILIEAMPDRAGNHFAVVGVGVNVHHTLDDFPEEIQGRATSLHLALRRTIDRPDFATRLLRTLAERVEDLADERFAELVGGAERRSSLLGRRVALQAGERRVEGVAEGLAPDGRLILRLGSGELECVGSGEATVVKE